MQHASVIGGASGLTVLRERCGAKIAALARANKNARVPWALLSRNEEFGAQAAA
jgi:hypothetical protein